MLELLRWYGVVTRVTTVTHIFQVKLPRVIQALCYAVGDLYLYKLSSKISSPLVGQWTLLCNCLSWFTFYCATRTLTNTAETTLVTIALYYYPWTRTAAMYV